MSNVYTDAAVTKLRSIIAAIDGEIAHAPPTPALRDSWKELIDVLAIGAAPQTRVCPTCKSVGMRAASRCGQCWTALEPLPELAVEVAA